MNGKAKEKKLHIHMFEAGKDRLCMRINTTRDEVGDDFLIGIDFQDDAANMEPDDYRDIAHFLIGRLVKAKKSNIIVPKPGEVLILNRAGRRRLN